MQRRIGPETNIIYHQRDNNRKTKVQENNRATTAMSNGEEHTVNKVLPGKRRRGRPNVR